MPKSSERPLCPNCKTRRMFRLKESRPGNAPRWQCKYMEGGKRFYCYSTVDPKAPVRDSNGNLRRAQGKTPIFKRTLGSRVERFLIPAAQNATPVHEGFVGAMEEYCNRRNAEILAIPIRYRNPTSHWSASQRNDETWDPRISSYLYNVRRKLNKNLVLLGDIKTQPTASSPLTGFEAITHGESGILGHTKLQLKTIAVPSGRFPKILATTGACTKPNYTDSKAGALGKFHHTLGAALVEIKDGIFHLRQINADKTTGAFIDLDYIYSDTGTSKAPRPLALEMGDTHVEAIDPDVERATFGSGGIIDTLKPLHAMWNDVLDGFSINHHHRGNPFIAVAKHYAGSHKAREEVMRALAFVASRTNGFKSIIKPSNHDDFLTTWLKTTDWRTDPDNAEFYLESALALVRAARGLDAQAEHMSAFSYWADKILGERDDIRVLKSDESFVLAGVEMGMHGHLGPDGARGAAQNLRRVGVKSMIGHSHSPEINEGCMQVGTSTRLRLGYNAGPSSWMNTHGLLYANGKRTLINIINGEWRHG